MKNRLPVWFKQNIPNSETLNLVHLFSEFGVHTVCQEAKCPNMSACFKKGQATFMILGNTCTRNCRFCAVAKSGTVLKMKQKCPSDGDTLRLSSEPSLFQEAHRISQLVKILGLSYVVITSVTRDDLADGGASIFAKTIELIHSLDRNINPVTNTEALNEKHKICNGVKVEVLIPDFKANTASLKCVLAAQPAVVAHNLETVARLYPKVRPMADYKISLSLLRKIKILKPELTTKSSLMLGLGETEGEVMEAMQDLKKSQCDLLTLGHYLAPSPQHYPVKEFIPPEQFRRYRDMGLEMGFKAVASAPLVRSSYQARELEQESLCMT